MEQIKQTSGKSILPWDIEARAEAFADGERGKPDAPDWDICKDYFAEGAKDITRLIQGEIERTILEDYGDYDEHDLEIVQGALARLYFKVKGLREKGNCDEEAVRETEPKLYELKKLADGMYRAAQYLTTDASQIRKAMEEYHQFVIQNKI